MPLDPQNVLKGRVLEGLLATAFRRAKYTVVPLGVEHQFPDIDALTVSEHFNNLPEGLRLLPDLMVYRWESDNLKVFFVEAKFRTRLSNNSVQDLKKKLEKQAAHWQDTYCVLALAERPTERTGGEYQQNYIRVIKSSDIATYPDDAPVFWGTAERVDKIFPEFKSFLKENPLTEEIGADYARTLEPLLDDTVKILKALGEITPRQK